MDTAAILQSLDAVRRRVRWLSAGYGVGVLVAGTAAVTVAVVTLDYMFNLPAWPRLTATLLGGILVVALLARHVIKPLLARIGLADIAGKLETVFPSLDDRLRTVVEYADRDIPGSDAMKQQVISQANSLAGSLNFAEVVQPRPVILSLGTGLTALLVVALLATVVVPNHARIAAVRLLYPFDNVPWPKAQRIDLLSEVPTRLPAGQRLDVRMRLGQGDRSGLRATLFSQSGDGAIQQQLMIRNPDGTYAAAVDTQMLNGSSSTALKLWIRSGDDEKHLQPVTVVERLMIASVEARVAPPAYAASLLPSTINLATAPAVAAIGSQVHIAVKFSKPIEGAMKLEPVSTAASQPVIQFVSAAPESDALRVVTLEATETIRFRVRATDRDGFENAGIEEYELIVRPDQSPTIQIEQPRRNEERTAEAVVPLGAVAEDDYGIANVSLHVERLSDHRKWELPLITADSPADAVVWARDPNSAERRRYRLGYAWELARLAEANLKSGEVIEFFLQATDNFSLGNQTHPPAVSGRLRITIISQDELASRVIDEMRLTRAQLEEVAKLQARVRTETTELADETRAKPSFDAADRTAGERMANQQSTAASQSRQLAQRLDGVRERLEENRSPRTDLAELSKHVSSSLDRTAEGSMKDATQQLSAASSPQQKQESRDAAMDRAQQSQATASEQLQSAMDKLGDMGSLQQAIDNVRRLLEEQERLTRELAELGKQNVGKRPEQMTPGDRQKLDDLAERQNELADRSANAISDLQKQSEQLEKSDPTSAEAMKQAAGTGQQQQVSPNQQKAAQEAKQNKQSSASAAQKQAEIGLQRMLQNLKEAESRRLAELQKQLADLQKQIGNLIRRQSGHNIDNLLLQGGKRVQQLAAEPLSALWGKAQRKPDAAQSTLPQLSQGQEQTERNARDIARQADALPDAAETVGKLTRAAGRMERANVQLRRNDFPAAYDPPQVEALAALEEARKLVDAQKEKVDEKVEEKKREAIRAVYIKVRDAQVQLNAETSRIDKSPRKEDGTLKREELIKLGQLPTEQAKLSEDIRGLQDRIIALGGVVYKFANDDIATTMDSVRQNLADKQTDAPTQLEQARVVRQLNSMIESLQDNPVDSKFAQDGGGGGGEGQQGGPRLPAEAELRLLKGLQAAVNDATQQLAQAPKKNDLAVKGMGDRQGQLRSVLNDLLEKSSQGELSLGPEPDIHDQLPDQAGDEAIDDQELDKDLLGGAADADAQQKKVSQVGDRMARSRQRLAVNIDPGKTTQAIQKRIMEDMDLLIEQARRQQAQSRNSDQKQQQSEAQAKQQPKPGEQQAQADNQGQQQQSDAKNAAEQSNAGGGLGQTQKPGAEIKETLREWGALSPRQRDAIIEGSGETVIEAYKKLVDDYYKSLATKATEK